MKRQITKDDFVLPKCSCLFFIPLLLFFSVTIQKRASAAAHITSVYSERSDQVEEESVVRDVEVRRQGTEYG